ncbi:uncharacterized protein F4812DRAFT_455621 [Daldinia caldariorum]|uniref:uncharacterized protein n=1 Tax=Daldinia caldariorum TaxID=326644 RepID=UPI00200827F4|nr:uncharacterized protein F4812DRAFT_455621 [Daldinia caldariorum]KAI1471507.1 hypothetical protein F4812DRAFT_455621 [Daldinia caldariorum]
MDSFRSVFVKASIGLALAVTALAAPNATAVPLAEGCAAYPGYDSATDMTGPLRVVADFTGTELDGFRFVPKFAIAVGGGSWGFMVIPTTEDNIAETPFRCGNGTLQARLNVGIQGDRWQALIAAGTPAESVFGFGLPDLPDPNYHLRIWYYVMSVISIASLFLNYLQDIVNRQILLNLHVNVENEYQHSHILDGTVQPGVFLGAVNVTTWGFNYQNNTEAGEYYFVRLLGPNSNNLATGKPLNPGEFTGYIKITAA